MRVLVVTKIFPNAAEPTSAPFNRQQFAALARRADLEILATIPWFPGAGLLRRWSSAGRLAEVPGEEEIDGLHVRHPRTLFFPRLAHSLWGPLYAASLAPAAIRYRGKIDLVLGSWAYPDGFAAILLGEALGVPAVIKVHGSDLNVIAQMPGPRRMMKRLLPRAARIVAVSRPLVDQLTDLGVAADRIAVVRNGVDPELFHPQDRAEARRALGLPDGKLIVYVGNLKASKGILDLAAAFDLLAARHPCHLAIVGDGEERAALTALAQRHPGRVTLAGARPLDEIPRWMAAADLLTLPSWNEGTPNVLLEAAACGRAVVATRVGGIPDLVTDPLLGELVAARSPPELAAALARRLADEGSPDAIAALGQRGGWQASADALYQVLVAARDRAGGAGPPGRGGSVL